MNPLQLHRIHGVGAAWTQRDAGYLHALLDSRGNLASAGRSSAARAALELIAEHPLVGSAVGPARVDSGHTASGQAVWPDAMGPGPEPS